MSSCTLLALVQSKILPLAGAIIGFSLLIVVHELGHFLFCKLFGIHTPTFSVGFGPTLWGLEKKIGQTTFKIAKFPLGGYVEIAGLAEPGQGEQQFAKDTSAASFDKKPYWQKFLVLSGGIIFNLAFAYLVACFLFMIGSSNKNIMITKIRDSSAAQAAGLKAGDKLLKVNNYDLSTAENYPKLLEIIQQNPNQTITLEVLSLDTTIAHEVSVTLDEKIFEDKRVGAMGAYFELPIPRLPFFQAIRQGIAQTNMWIYSTAYSFKMLFAQRSLEGAGGPIQIMAQMFNQAQYGILPLLIFLALISINLALINLLPLGVTDGGQLFFATVEAIIRRPAPEWLRIGVNIVSIGLFVILFAYLTYKDIVSVFGSTLANLYNKIMMLFS